MEKKHQPQQLTATSPLHYTKEAVRACKKLRVIVSLELQMLQKLFSNYTCFDGRSIGCCVQAGAGLFKLNGLAIQSLQCAYTLPQYSLPSGSLFSISQ